ncbi:mTERF domain-containing protein 2 [Trichinella sp. T9]|uniref:mTERF domain-containing protein 2 n=1 Tax=Trichinella murrelli TaxID=144512 RepID=A0A0V0TR63_9BILA|nr:mTERF domain-containing protein 2 [Trichinella murrelli]KRX54660.1 mTERF domain-containing protein 2 [Trichinella sp. T9]
MAFCRRVICALNAVYRNVTNARRISSSALYCCQNCSKNNNPEMWEKLTLSIVEQLRRDGYSVLLKAPFACSDLFSLLHEAGLSDEEIEQAMVSNPDLLNSNFSHFSNFLFLLRQCDLSTKEALDVMNKFTRHDSINLEQAKKMLHRLAVCGIASKSLRKMLLQYPSLLSLSEVQVHNLFESLTNFFTVRQIIFMAVEHPDILHHSFDDLESKYEFLYHAIHLENTNIYQSRWFAHSLAHLQCRFECAIRCGVYTVVDKKRPLKKSNLKLKDIVDTDDDRFATSVCKITPMEYSIFQKMFQRQTSFENIFGEN